MGFSTQHPMNVVGRCLLLEKIRKMDPKKLVESETLLKTIPQATFSYDEVQEGTEETVEIVEINWEFLLFDATMHQLQTLFDEFFKKDEVVRIGTEVPKDIREYPVTPEEAFEVKE